jgi:hypothetical protein
MFMISLTVLFHSGLCRFMDDRVKKFRLLLKFAMRVLSQLLSDYGRTTHLLHFCGIYATGNNCRRPRQAINGKTPTQVIHLESRQTPIPAIQYSKTPEVDGLITSFKLAA